MADDRIIEVYRRERGQIARSVARIAGDSAEDIVHDAFEAYLSHAPWALRPGAWISRVARNRALNTRRGIRLVPLEGHEETVTEISDLEREAVGSEVAEALAALPDRPRRALRMRFFEAASYEEVAEALDVRVPQAHVIVHRALRMLGREMVRRMADAHGAAACAPFLARMAGIGGDEQHEHGLEPCRACRPAWDEIVALRAVNGFVPWFLGLGAGVKRAFRKVLEGSTRRPDIVEPAGRLATTMMAVGVAAASAFAAPAAVASSAQTRIDGSRVAAVTAPAVTHAPPVRAAAPSTASVQKPDPSKKQLLDGARVPVKKNRNSVQAEPRPIVQPPVGIVVCPPESQDCEH